MTNQNLNQAMDQENEKSEELQDADLEDISGGAQPQDPEADCFWSMSCGTFSAQKKPV